MSRPVLFLLAAVGALSACAPVAAPSADTPASPSGSSRQCFYADQVDNFRGDNQTLYIRGRNKDVFELKTLGYCADIDFALGIAFVPDAGMNRLCTGDMTRIGIAGGGSPRTPCRVQVVKKLSEAEIEALPARNRP